jgi:RimJ/RimL family protein N-acetyltransferase
MVAADVFRGQPTLVGDRVRLEQLGPAVLQEYWQMLQEPEGGRLTGTHAEFTLEQTEAWLRSRADQYDRADWAAFEIRSGAFVGEVVLNDLDPSNDVVGFRIGLAGPAVYGRGFGTEMTRLVLDFAFSVGLHRVELEVYGFNPRARRVYEKCGFQLEGRRRDALLWDGARHDALLMAVLRTDPRPSA